MSSNRVWTTVSAYRAAYRAVFMIQDVGCFLRLFLAYTSKLSISLTLCSLSITYMFLSIINQHRSPHHSATTLLSLINRECLKGWNISIHIYSRKWKKKLWHKCYVCNWEGVLLLTDRWRARRSHSYVFWARVLFQGSLIQGPYTYDGVPKFPLVNASGDKEKEQDC